MPCPFESTAWDLDPFLYILSGLFLIPVRYLTARYQSNGPSQGLNTGIGRKNTRAHRLCCLVRGLGKIARAVIWSTATQTVVLFRDTANANPVQPSIKQDMVTGSAKTVVTYCALANPFHIE